MEVGAVMLVVEHSGKTRVMTTYIAQLQRMGNTTGYCSGYRIANCIYINAILYNIQEKNG